MKIKIKDIRAEGIDVAFEISAREVGLSEQEYLYLIEALRIKAHVERVEGTVIMKCKASTRYHSFCSRTLVAVERDWSAEFLLDFAIERSTEFIEPDDDIRQEVILGLPVKVLCDEELKKETTSAQSAPVNEMKEAMAESQKTYQPFADLKLRKE